jgi:ABC-type bacteriocin/lantibiotic exporter with double-glycine peptidase domain
MSVGRACELCGLDSDGVTLDQLDRVARSAGLEVQAVELSYVELSHILLPGIVPLDEGAAVRHYVVAWHVSDAGVVVWDPAEGASLVVPDEFVRRWSPSYVLSFRLPVKRTRTKTAQ